MSAYLPEVVVPGFGEVSAVEFTDIVSIVEDAIRRGVDPKYLHQLYADDLNNVIAQKTARSSAAFNAMARLRALGGIGYESQRNS